MDRKAMARAYKEARRPMGIFAIRHIESGRTLIGKSADLPGALNRERAQLKWRGHPNRALQADYDAHGAAAFAFEVLDTLTPPEEGEYNPAADLAVLEAMWLERLEPYDDRGYAKRKVTRG